MTTIESSLPAPTSEARAASDRLRRLIVERIDSAGGWISFEDYMQMALYEPGLGYYSAGSRKLGADGDFVTAPEISALLGRSIAQFALESGSRPGLLDIVELGAGTGQLALQVIEAGTALGARDLRYRILEPSADLRQRQQVRLEAFPGIVSWLQRLPDPPFDGLIVANEVVDALPVVRFVKQGGTVRELGVGCEGGRFGWVAGDVDPRLEREVCEIERKIGSELANGYQSELRRVVPPWLSALHSALASGAVLLIDYGLVRREYYHPQRTRGTLICHYRHRAHDDPFVYPGLQDLSAWVDFSACADAARSAGFAVAGFTTQASFLLSALAAGGPAMLDAASPQDLSGLKTLILPGEMGERFKVMLLGKNLPTVSLPGKDYRSWL